MESGTTTFHLVRSLDIFFIMVEQILFHFFADVMNEIVFLNLFVLKAIKSCYMRKK